MCFFFFKQKTAYDMRISDWSSDVCSSDLANAADLLTSDCDPYDQPFVTGTRTQEGFYKVRAGLDQAIARGLAYAPYADLIWCETAKPDLDEARRFAEAIRSEERGVGEEGGSTCRSWWTASR